MGSPISKVGGRRDGAMHHLSGVRAASLAAGLALALLAMWQSESQITLAAIVIACVVASAAGEPRLLLFALGLAVAGAGASLHAIPPGAFAMLSAAVGALLRAGVSRAKVSFNPLLVLASIASGLYWAASPPATNAGAVAAFALVAIPTGILVLRFTLSLLDLPEEATAWFALGAGVFIGWSLWQTYRTVGGDYSAYQDARVFTSAIGSSNYAAALGIIPGLLFLAWGLKRPKARSLFLVIAAPFLAAPLVFASRGAVFALLAGALTLGVAHTGPTMGLKVGRILSIFAAAGVVVYVASDQQWYIWQRFTEAGNGAGYLSGRTELWQSTLDTIVAHPLSGLGPGHLTDFLLSRYGLAYSHQFFLAVFAQTGLLGGFVYLWAICPRPMLKWSMATPAIVALLVNSAIEPVMDTPIGAMLFAGLVALHWGEGMVRKC